MRILAFMLFAPVAFATQTGIPQGVAALEAHEEHQEQKQMQEEETCFVTTFKGPEKNAKITAVIQEQVGSRNDIAEKQLVQNLMKRTKGEGFNFTSRVDCN